MFPCVLIFVYKITKKKGEDILSNMLDMTISKEQQEEINEFLSILLLLPAEDRAVLLSNANAFKVRRDIEKARKEKQ